MLKLFVLRNILLNADAGIDTGGGGAATSTPPANVNNDVPADDSGGDGEPDVLPPVPAGGLQTKQPTTLEVKLGKMGNTVKTKATGNAKPEGDELKETIGTLDDLDDKGIITETIAERKKREDKEEADKTKKVETDKVAEAEKVKAGQRDYSVFSADEQALVKTAPNALFNYLKDTLPKLRKEKEETIKQLEDAKKGIVKIPDSYYENPEAYVLLPEYRQFRQAHALVSQEEQHWLNQLENIENGREWNGLTGRDDKGNLVLSEAIADTGAKAKDYINQQLAKARGYKEQFVGKVNHLKQTHQETFKTAANVIREGCKQHCPWMTDDKILKSEIEFENPETKKIEKASVGDVLKLAYSWLPPVFRNHPLAEAWANTFVVQAVTQQKNRQLTAQLGVKKQNKEDQLEAEPVGQTRAQPRKGAEVNKDTKVPDLSDM